MARLMIRQYVYETVQRGLHWWIALATLALIVSGLVGSNLDAGLDRQFTWDLHILVGKLLIIGLVGRLVWGVIGPKHARFSAFFYFRDWAQTLKTRKILSADGEFGHHQQASASYLAFYALIVLMSITGLVLAAMIFGEGPLASQMLDELYYQEVIQEIHEYGMWAIVLFAVTHVAALIYHEWQDHIPIAQSMVSGFQYRTVKEKNDEKVQ